MDPQHCYKETKTFLKVFFLPLLDPYPDQADKKQWGSGFETMPFTPQNPVAYTLCARSSPKLKTFSPRRAARERKKACFPCSSCSMDRNQGATNRCCLSWLTNSALVYEPKCGGEGGSCGVSANEYSCTQEPKESLEI
jgi:hypothetical protein